MSAGEIATTLPSVLEQSSGSSADDTTTTTTREEQPEARSRQPGGDNDHRQTDDVEDHPGGQKPSHRPGTRRHQERDADREYDEDRQARHRQRRVVDDFGKERSGQADEDRGASVGHEHPEQRREVLRSSVAGQGDALGPVGRERALTVAGLWRREQCDPADDQSDQQHHVGQDQRVRLVLGQQPGDQRADREAPEVRGGRCQLRATHALGLWPVATASPTAPSRWTRRPCMSERWLAKNRLAITPIAYAA